MEHVTAAYGTGIVTGLWNPRSGHENLFTEMYFTEAKEMGLGGVRMRLRLSRERIDLMLKRPWETVRRTLRAMRWLDLNVKVSMELEPSPENRVVLDERRRDAFGNPGASLYLRPTERDKETMRYGADLVRRTMPKLGAEGINVVIGLREWEHHHMGTCRMGDDPNTSVVDRNLRVHGCDNLYVAGSAPFVTGSVSNPTLTLVALSLRLADHLTSALRPVPVASEGAGFLATRRFVDLNA
jgi:choline dehydrogenase-like flavoprotein